MDIDLFVVYNAHDIKFFDIGVWKPVLKRLGTDEKLSPAESIKAGGS